MADAGAPEPSAETPALEYAAADVVAGRPPPRRGCLLALAAIALVVLLLVLVILPSMGLPREAGQRMKCTSNLRQIGIALHMFANDNGGVFPGRVEQLVADGHLASAEFFCPNADYDTNALKGGTSTQVAQRLANARHSYVYVGQGVRPGVASPATVVAYELPGHHPVRRYRPMFAADRVPGGHVLFADGDVVFIPDAVLRQMIQQLNAGQNPPPATAGYARTLAATAPTIR